MATAKRLYLYTASGVGLALALAGAVVMLRTFLNEIGIGPQGAPADAGKETLALALGLLVAGLIVWLIHWTLVERMVEGAKDDAAIAERRSIVRAIYFVAVLGITLYVAASQLVGLVAKVICDILKADPLTSSDASVDVGPFSFIVNPLVSLVADMIQAVIGLEWVTAPLASIAAPLGALVALGAEDDSWVLSLILVAAATWAYHVWIRDRDLRQTSVITGAAAWISRHYLYGAALVALIVGLDSIVVAVKTIAGEWAKTATTGPLDVMSGQGGVPTSADWVRPVIVALVGVAIWGAVWLGHWLYSLRLRTGNGQQASAERGSRTRLAFLALVIFWAAATVVAYLGSSLAGLLASLMDVAPKDTPTWYLVVVPIVAAIPAAAALWWHNQQAVAENAVGGVPGVSAVRIILYVIALVGIWALVAGAVAVLENLLLQVFDPQTSANANAWKEPVAAGVGGAVVGAVAWAWAWWLAQARRVANFAVETVSSARSYYLRLVLGAAVVVGAVALATIVYKYSRIVLSLKDDMFAMVVAPAIAAAVVAGVVIAYHAWVLNSDKNPPAPRAAAAPVAKPVARGGKAPTKKAPARKPAARAAAPKATATAKKAPARKPAARAKKAQ